MLPLLRLRRIKNAYYRSKGRKYNKIAEKTAFTFFIHNIILHIISFNISLAVN